MRLFVALPLPEEIRFQVSLLCEGLPGVRWVPPDNFHITLRFLGEVDGRDFHDIDAALAGIRVSHLKLRLSGVGHFGNGTVRAIWAGVEKTPALQHLREKVESAVVRAGATPEGYKFTPHVTLTRSKNAPIGKVKEYLAGHSLFRTPEFEVDEFVLYSSFLGSTNAIYRPEREYELSPY